MLDGEQGFLPLFLSECACVNGGSFNRLQNNRRNNIENHIIQNTLFDLPKTEQLDYLGFGSGHLLEDLFIIVKLIQAGYININIHLVDPIYQGNINEFDSINQFRCILLALVKQEKIKIDTCFYESIESYQNSNSIKKIKIATAIDFDDHDKAFKELTKIFSVLSSEGKFYLAYSGYDLYFDCNGCFQFFNHHVRKTPEVVRQLHHDIANTVASIKNDHHIINIAMFIPDGQDKLHLYYLIPTLKNVQNKIILTLFSSKRKELFCDENLVKYVKQFLPVGQEIEIKFVRDFAEFKKSCEHNFKYDVITELGYISNVADQHYQDIRWLQAQFPQAIHYYSMKQRAQNSTENLFDNTWRWDTKNGPTFFQRGAGFECIQEDYFLEKIKASKLAP